MPPVFRAWYTRAMPDRAKPVKVKVSLPHPALPRADWADCYRLHIAERGVTAMDAARRTLGHFPPWVRVLMTMRNGIVRLFGLKTSHYAMGAVETVGFFPVITKSPSQVVLGFDDRHLDFRVVIDVQDDTDGETVSVTTLVWRKVTLGKLYIAAITPFHNLIVYSMLASLTDGV
jgi:Protein of unknown function (DUF2867)